MSYSEFGELIMKLSRAALRPLLAAHERGVLPLVGAAWGVTARKASHNASNARGDTAGKMGRNSSLNNASITQRMRFPYINGFILETCHTCMASLIISLK